ncbi:DUF1351 domain-containing protein [Leptogranulimonas caecicola]|uniref:DUF1351 domain-containing protein n=1 Tax=Leptogranulimonas caecicola TaxID=2894156 RepID=UPI001BED4C05|nr:hypothetical protein ATOBIA_N05610 [Atopobiaceae bacterium P1]
MSKAVEPDQVETPDELSITFQPASITAHFDALDAKIDELLAGTITNIDVDDAEQMRRVRKDRTYINGAINSLEDRRKAIKRAYSKPLTDFEDDLKLRINRLKEASATYTEALNEADKIARAKRAAVLEEAYYDMAPALVPVVPWERIYERSWTNKTHGEVRAKEDLAAKVAKIAADWETLKGLGLENQEDAELEFFQTLNLSSAITHAKEALERKARLEAMKAEVEQEPTPEPVPEPQEKRQRMVIFIDQPITAEEARTIGRVIGSHGFTGTFKAGELGEYLFKTYYH